MFQNYYTVAETAKKLSCCSKTVLRRLHKGELGLDVVNVSNDWQPDYRIPESGITAFLQARRVFASSQPGLVSQPEPQVGIAARSIGELRRKARM